MLKLRWSKTKWINDVAYSTHSIFHIGIPVSCPGVPSEVLSPKETWKDDDAYYTQANKLAEQFNENFEKFADIANDEIIAAAPKIKLKV